MRQLLPPAMLMLATTCALCGQGVAIVPGEGSVFNYADDYSTPRCLAEAFLTNTGAELWESDQLVSSGPARNRTITYRFTGDRVITACDIEVDQWANARNLGGQNWLYLSRNGLDWALVRDSNTQEGDGNGWQYEPFVVGGDETAPFVGGLEVWLRLTLDNHSGLKTTVSNMIKGLEVKLSLGDPAAAAVDPQADLRRAWGEARRRGGWTAISLDAADPEGRRAPHYYEDADGWLRAPGESSLLLTDERAGLRVQRVYLSEKRSPLSLACFAQVPPGASEVLARITVDATSDSSRRLEVKWDGRVVGALDAAAFIPERKTFLARLSPCAAGVHELRLEPADQGVVEVDEIALVGPQGLAWSAKPSLAAGAAPVVICAQYLPDPQPPAASQVVEGRHAAEPGQIVFAGLQSLYRDYEQFGALRVILRNPGPSPIRLSDGALLNGKPIAESYVDFGASEWDARGVVWHRMRPQTLQPGQCGELYIRFRKRPAGEAATLTLPSENAAPVEVRVPYSAPSVGVDYATLDKERGNLLVYLRAAAGTTPGSITAVALDGRIVRGARILGGGFEAGVALVIAPLDRPLEPMSFHAITARTSTGALSGAQFRVLPWMFPRSSIHVPSELCAEMGMNLGMWHHRPLEECRRFGLPTTTNTDRMFGAHEMVRYILGPDEPDAGDNRGGGYDRGLGYHARRLRDSAWTDLVESEAPHVASWIIMNGTTRPLNWCVYGQLADVSCFDPYPINFYGADHAYVRESLSFARQCGAPHPMYACLEAFGWGAGQGVPSGARGPSPDEWCQNLVQALGSGAKGLTSWVYVSGAGGWQLSEPARREMARMNALIARLEDLLLLGTPVDWASTDAGSVATGVVGDERWPKERVWAGAVLCGADAVVVAVANHIPASKPNEPTITPGRDVTVTVRLPEYLSAVTLCEVTEAGETPVVCKVGDGKARFTLDSIAAGRVFVLKRAE